MVTLDFRKCKTAKDVEKIFDQNKELLGLISKENIIKRLNKDNKTLNNY